MLLTSVGPDEVPDLDPFPDWHSSETLEKLYDPTNGTMSQGDLVFPRGVLPDYIY